VPHQEINASPDQILECVLVRSDGGAIAINHSPDLGQIGSCADSFVSGRAASHLLEHSGHCGSPWRDEQHPVKSPGRNSQRIGAPDNLSCR